MHKVVASRRKFATFTFFSYLLIQLSLVFTIAIDEAKTIAERITKFAFLNPKLNHFTIAKQIFLIYKRQTKFVNFNLIN